MKRSLALQIVEWLVLGAAFCSAHAQSPTTRPGQTDWPSFRGDAQLTGVAITTLPERLAVRWKYEAAEAVTSTAAITRGVVYVGCHDGNLYALDLTTGRLKWKYAAKGPIESSPTVVAQAVFFGDQEGLLHAVDTQTGRARWTFAAEGQIISSPNHQAGRLVFGSYDNVVYCLAARDGKLIWKHETQDMVHGTPAIVRERVVFAGCDGKLHVIRLADGQEVAAVKLGSPCGASAACQGKHAFIGTVGGQVLAIDWSAARTLWTYEDPERQLPIVSSAAITPDAVIVGGRDKRLIALDPHTGRPRWTFITKGKIESSPVVVRSADGDTSKDRVFVGSADGNVYALNLTTGRETWRFETGSAISASPAVAADCLVIATEDGVIYCFGRAARSQRSP